MQNRIREEFGRLFGGEASLYAAPGRVNLIGEHTDYNLGFVLPGAIDKAIYAALRPVPGGTCKIYSLDYGTMAELDTNGPKPAELWLCYIYGVISEMRKRGAAPGAFECVFGGNVPLGAGLSSSAALESVFGFALNDMFSLGFSREELAVIGQMTEHNYVGVRCGIMDQFASLFGRAGTVIKLDCRSLEYEPVPFDPAGCRIALIDSMVTHSLAGSEYNLRRAQCEAGVAVVARHVDGVASLRDATHETIDRYKDEMDEVVYRRCKYVVEENERLLMGCEDLERGDYAAFGRRMFGSHEGLSRDYEVSCRELDFIVDIARKTEGVLGGRLMGGGFGGCVISLVKDEALEGYLAEVRGRFEKEFGKIPRVIDVVIGDGARRVQ